MYEIFLLLLLLFILWQRASLEKSHQKNESDGNVNKYQECIEIDLKKGSASGVIVDIYS